MGRNSPYATLTAATLVCALLASGCAVVEHLQLEWEAADPRLPDSGPFLVISGPRLAAPIKIHYIEAFVRSGSSNQDWSESVIPHRTTLIARSEDGSALRLRSEVSAESESHQPSTEPPVVVEHDISASADEVSFIVTAWNRGEVIVDVLWAQPCVRVGDFTGRGLRWYEEDHYLDACFIFLDGQLTTLDETPRSSHGFYTPGQVYAPAEVSREDLNPRPLSPAVPSSGLIGCYSADSSMLVATAWEPYQELFQGIATCIHADFRIGGLAPGQKKTVRGKIYLLENDLEQLLQRYRADFRE